MNIFLIFDHITITIPRLILWRIYEDNPVFGLFGPPFTPGESPDDLIPNPWPDSLRPYLVVLPDGNMALVITQEQLAEAGVKGYAISA